MDAAAWMGRAHECKTRHDRPAALAAMEHALALAPTLYMVKRTGQEIDASLPA